MYVCTTCTHAATATKNTNKNKNKNKNKKQQEGSSLISHIKFLEN